MASLTEKLRILVKSKLHGLLDRAIDMNSPEVLKQYIRDLEDAMGETDAAAATARADVNIATREIVSVQALIKKTSDEADALLADTDPTNDHWVTDTLEPRQMQYEEDLKAKQEALTGLQQAATSLTDVAAKLRKKHGDMKTQFSRLSALASSAEAKQKAADAIQAAGAASGSIDASASVDNIAKRIERNNEIADQKLAQATGSFSDGAADAVAQSEAAARTAARRARLAAAKGQTGGAPTT